MKSKELIRQLQEADPSGEIEVCIDNADIHFVETMSAYWDGKLQVLKRDHSKDPYFNIVGAKYVVSGSKIKIHTLSITDLISDFPDITDIDYSELGASAEEYKIQHEKTRALSRDIERRCELGLFQRWAEAKAKELTPDYDKDQLYHQAELFFDKNLSPKDPLPELPPVKDEHGSWWPSVRDRREHQWNNSITFGWSGLDFEFSKK